MFKDRIIDLDPDNGEETKKSNPFEEAEEKVEQAEETATNAGPGPNELIVFAGLLAKKIAPVIFKTNPRVARAVGIVAEGVTQAVVKDRIGNRAIANQVIENSVNSLDGMLDDLKSKTQ